MRERIVGLFEGVENRLKAVSEEDGYYCTVVSTSYVRQGTIR